MGRLDFRDVTERELDLLAHACDPATFGLNQENILDETYRKAGKIDAEHFLAAFDPEKLGLIQAISDELLDGNHATRTRIRAERYKLNVYGQGAFFKSHKDTPRGASMFGSLVIVFPSPHEGGALVLRDHGIEETFDSSVMLRDGTQTDGPCVAFVAFFSDVEHEVQEVLSGHRVTLTYNLYFDWKHATGSVGSKVQRDQSKLHQALRDLLDDPLFLPNGGYLGFGLHREYPVQHDIDISSLLQFLKGSDATVLSACKALSLNAAPYLLFKDEEPFWNIAGVEVEVLCPHKPRLECMVDVQLWEELLSNHSGKLINPPRETLKELRDRGLDVWKVEWVIPPSEYNGVTIEYAAYGNEPSIGYVYSRACLVVAVGPAGERWGSPPGDYDYGPDSDSDEGAADGDE